ncbi:kinase-like domain-containing protein [Flammula alnicola]|nr:kinase-like domain-containing protein [Flammula alnicola]
MSTVTERLQATRAKINWDQVFKTASSIRSQPCTSDGDEFSGGCNIVYCIAFEDGTRWALRIPYDEMLSAVESTVTTMRYVHSTVPDIPIATVHAWSDSEDGDGVGTPYMLLDWIEGRTLEWNASFPPPVARGKVLAQLAQYSAHLLAHTLMQSSTQSALEWVLRRIDSRLTRIFTGDLPSFDPIDCLIYRAMAEEKYHLLSLDALPFPLMHTDLNRMNILVDDNFNINGILDWDDWACRLPLQYAVMCPAMIAADNDPLHDAFHKDRLAFIDHFASAISSSGLPDDIAVHLPSIMADDELQIFQSSIGSKGVYAYWVTKYSVRSTQWIKAATRALDKFILTHPEMANLSEVLSVRVCLLGMQEEGFGH